MADELSAVGRAAVRLALAGVPVFPCHPGWGGAGGKRPLIRDGFKVASARVDQVTLWWFRWPDALIGTVPGAAAAVVVDLDPAPGEKPADVLCRLSEVAGEMIPADGPSVVTQSGGVHLWFRRPEVPEGAVIGNRKPCRGVDFRADNGYVIVPPSRMASGRRYQWAVPWTAGEPLPECPPGLRALLLREDEAARPAPVASSGPVPARVRAACGDGRLRRYVEAALDRAHDEVARAGKGERNIRLNGVAFSIGQLVGAGAVAEPEAARVLEQAAAISGLLQDDGRKAVTATIASGLRSGQAVSGRAAARVAEIVDQARGRGATGTGTGPMGDPVPEDPRRGQRQAGALWRAGVPVAATAAMLALARFRLVPEAIEARYLPPAAGGRGASGDLMLPIRDGTSGGVGVVRVPVDGAGEAVVIGYRVGAMVRVGAAERRLMLAVGVPDALRVAGATGHACWAGISVPGLAFAQLPGMVRDLVVVHRGEVDAAALTMIRDAQGGFGRQVTEMRLAPLAADLRIGHLERETVGHG